MHSLVSEAPRALGTEMHVSGLVGAKSVKAVGLSARFALYEAVTDKFMLTVHMHSCPGLRMRPATTSPSFRNCHPAASLPL